VHGLFELRAHDRRQVADERVAIELGVEAFSIADHDAQTETAVLGGE
jgi:hypothetical protein